MVSSSPGLFHIGTDDNVSDDPSRLRALRTVPAVQPVWLSKFLAGQQKYFDLARAADDRLWQLAGWSRFGVLLLALDRDASAAKGDPSHTGSCQSGPCGGTHSCSGGSSTGAVPQVLPLGGDELRCDFNQICSSGLLLSTALVGYGKCLFYSGQPKYVLFPESTNAKGLGFGDARESVGYGCWVKLAARFDRPETHLGGVSKEGPLHSVTGQDHVHSLVGRDISADSKQRCSPE